MVSATEWDGGSRGHVLNHERTEKLNMNNSLRYTFPQVFLNAHKS